MRLIKNWRRFWRLYSTWASGLGAAAASAWMVVPQDMRAAVPDHVQGGIALGIFLLVILARVIDQGEGDA